MVEGSMVDFASEVHRHSQVTRTDQCYFVFLSLPYTCGKKIYCNVLGMPLSINYHCTYRRRGLDFSIKHIVFKTSTIYVQIRTQS